MSNRFSTLSIEAIAEEPEDGAKEADEDSPCDTPYGQQARSHELGMKANPGRESSRRNRPENNKQSSKGKIKNTTVPMKKGNAAAPRDFEEYSRPRPRPRYRRNVSKQAAASSSSSEEELDEQVEDRRTTSARARLTSPSMVSTNTAVTTATNKSSSSSGSNSTVTQSSASKGSYSGKKAEIEHVPMSPTAPDPPNAFTFVDNGRPLQQEPDSDEDGVGQEERTTERAFEKHIERPTRRQTKLPKPRAITEAAHEEPVSPTTKSERVSASSSASSSFHGEDNFSERPHEDDTDLSTSPERSDRGHQDEHETSHTRAPSDEVAAKIASQIAAARQRQGSHSSSQVYGMPETPRGNVQAPHIPQSAMSARPPYQAPQQAPQRPLPRAEQLPVTGYELLAARLASSSSIDPVEGPLIKPIYRKFEALNHRLLLHLQDELSELEEQLQRIDNADTQSRLMDRHIIPASRRAATQAGAELQWHKTDVLGRIGFKLAQYNQALSSFNSTQSLAPPAPEDIDDYRDYLYTEQLIAEAETHFLDPEEDLVSISRHSRRMHHYHRSNSYESGSRASSAVSSRVSSIQLPRSTPPSPSTSITPKTSKQTKPTHKILQNQPSILAGVIALAVLIPILSFLVIPGVLGRVIVTILVALSVIAGLLQTDLAKNVLSQEGGMYGVLYGGVMLVIAFAMA